MLMDLIKARHSIRKYTAEPISREALETILEAGNYAPNAGGGQHSMLVGVLDCTLVRKLGVLNMRQFDRSALLGSYVSREQPSVIDDPSIRDGFYGAPCVVCIFGPNHFRFREADAFCCAENMLLQATELGIASCIISRAPETFDSAEGRGLMRQWGVPETYSAVCFVILGYLEGEQPHAKPRRPGRVKIIDNS